MNWWRARAILIVSFIALDVFLGYVAFGVGGVAGEVTGTEVQRTVEQLKALGITVTAQVPRQVTASSFLSIKMGQKDSLQMVKKLLGTAEPKLLQSSAGVAVWANSAGSRVFVLATGVILYDAENVQQETRRELDERGARALAERFITSTGLMPSDARLDFSQQMSATRFVVQYRQEYQGVPLFGGYITVTVDQGSVTRLRYAWFTPVGIPEKRRMVVPVTDALIKALPVMREQLKGEATLEKIEMGYLTDAIDAREWDAFPVWRLSFKGGTFIYLNGYSGDFEKIEETK